MEERDDPSSQDNRYSDPDFTLAGLLAILWRSRRLFLAVMTPVVAIAMAGTFYSAAYTSEGLFRFGGAIPIPQTAEYSTLTSLAYNDEDKKIPPGIGFTDFKLLAAFYSTTERFDEFVRANALESAEGIMGLRSLFASPAAVSKVLEPVQAFTKQDAKNLVEQPKDLNSNVIGLRITYTSASPQLAQQMVQLLARYAMDSIAYDIYSSTVPTDCSAIKTKLVRYETYILNKTELMAELRRRADSLREIVHRYPDSSSAAVRQVVSVTEQSARYLPPVTLLATTEVDELDAREAIRKAEIERSKAALLGEYCERLKTSIGKTRSGEAVLRNLEKIRDEVFKGKNLDDDVVKQVHQGITIANQIAMAAYLQNSRFIAGPTLPSRSNARPGLTLALGLIVGFVCALGVVIVKHWWTENRDTISA